MAPPLSKRLSKEDEMARKYDPRAGKEVEKTMHEYKHEGKFKNRQQAVAVGLSKARQKGEHVPEK
ncbi:MAG TPA: DUF6496 domain-containing protein [Candidatus Saccharimonadales bacterium]|nr:DUF6496 domain-containing protein [Candidatus Saccharimonadales bacterium]